jgi:hypothetical protein
MLSSVSHATREYVGKKTLTAGSNPAPAGNVGDGQPVADEVARLGLAQLRVHDAVQAARLVLVPVDAVLDLLGRVSCHALA